jgi:hypothetical protein
MKTMKIAGLALATALVASGAYAGLVIGTTAPADVLASITTQSTYTRLFDKDTNIQACRGNIFNLGDTGDAETGFNVNSISVRKNGNDTFSVGDTLSLYIFKGSTNDWETGTGYAAGTSTSYYEGTTVTPVYNETFDLSGTVADDSFITFDLASTIEVDENADYGFFMIYESADNGYIQLDEASSGTSGQRLYFTDSVHGYSNTRDLNYWVSGTVIPEPATLGLFAAFGGAVMFIRRRFSI